VSLYYIPVQLFPPISFPAFTISTEWENYPAAMLEEQVTIPLESRLSSVTGVHSIQSLSRNGESFITLTFPWTADRNQKYLEVKEKLEHARGALPNDASNPILQHSLRGSAPLFVLAVTPNDSLVSDPIRLQDWVQNILTRRIEGIGGILRAEVFGLEQPGISFTIDPLALKRYQIQISSLEQQLRTLFEATFSGQVSDRQLEFNMRFQLPNQSIQQLREYPIQTENAWISLGLIADIREEIHKPRSFSRVNGKQAILLELYTDQFVSVEKVNGEIRDLINGLNKTYPGIKTVVVEEGVSESRETLTQLGQTLLFSTICAIIVIFIFLRRVRRSAVMALIIPTSLLLTIILLYQFGISLNSISIAGLLLSVGLLVDNSIIIIDLIDDTVQKHGVSMEEMKKALRGIRLPISASTFTTVSIFIPVFFLGGFERVLFEDLAISFTISLLVSMFVALEILPAMLLHYSGVKSGNSHSAVTNSLLYQSYFSSWKWGARHPVSTVILLLIISIATITTFLEIPLKLLPERPDTEMKWLIEMEPGTSLQATERELNNFAGYIQLRYPDADVILKGGSSASARFEELASQGTNRGVLKILHNDSNTLNEISRQLDKLASKYTSMNFQRLPGRDFIEQIIYSHAYPYVIHFLSNTSFDPKKAEKANNIIKQHLNPSKIRFENQRGIQWRLPFRTQSAYNLNPHQVQLYSQLQTDGSIISEGQYQGNQRTLRMYLNTDKFPERELFYVPLFGQWVPADCVLTREISYTPVTLQRFNNMSSIPAAVNSETLDLKKVQTTSQNLQRETGYFDYSITGNKPVLDQLSKNFMWLFSGAVVLMLAIMTAQFEGFTLGVIVLASIPFAWAGSILLLFVSGGSLNLFSVLGLLIVTGIAVNDAILKATAFRDFSINQRPLRAMINAGKLRFRPIIMTSLTTIAALLPFYFMNTTQNIYQIATATTIIGGLIAATILNLYVLPFLLIKVQQK
jgi:HAE1 family hydrophobic/amphiphilic exporter-1